jgi:hypothetical protein
MLGGDCGWLRCSAASVQETTRRNASASTRLFTTIRASVSSILFILIWFDLRHFWGCLFISLYNFSRQVSIVGLFIVAVECLYSFDCRLSLCIYTLRFALTLSFEIKPTNNCWVVCWAARGKKKGCALSNHSLTLSCHEWCNTLSFYIHTLYLYYVLYYYTLYIYYLSAHSCWMSSFFDFGLFVFKIRIYRRVEMIWYNLNSKSSCIRWKFSPNYTYLHVSHYFIKIATDWVCYHWFLYFWLSYFIFILLIIFFPSPPPIFSVGWLHPAMIF